MMSADLVYSLVFGIVVGLLTSVQLVAAAAKAVRLPADKAARLSFAWHCVRLLVMAIPAVFLWLGTPFVIWAYFAALVLVKLFVIVRLVKVAGWQS